MRDIEELKERARHRDRDALRELGDHYYREGDMNEASNCYNDLCNLGDYSRAEQLAKMFLSHNAYGAAFEYGVHIENEERRNYLLGRACFALKDYQKAYGYLIECLPKEGKESEIWLPGLYRLLARMYESGLGCDADLDKALEYHMKDASLGYRPETYLEIGRFYHEGRGVPKDDEIALKWWREAIVKMGYPLPEGADILFAIALIEKDRADELCELANALASGEALSDEMMKEWEKVVGELDSSS